MEPTIRKPYVPELCVIDGNALAFSSLFSHDMLSARVKGKIIYTGMPFGFIKKMMAVKKQFKPRHFEVVWDGGNHRKKEIYPQYKMGRKIYTKNISFDDIITSLVSCRKLLKHLGIPQYRIHGEEGDDVLASLAELHAHEKVLILSNDHDMFQLLQNTNFKFLKFKSKDAKIFTKSSFEKTHHGMEPKYYSHFLAIVGDKTDKIPGVKGIGEVKAYEILTQLKIPTVKNLYEQLDTLTMKPKVKEMLVKGREDAFMFLKLTKLRKDLELTPLYQPILNRQKLFRYMDSLKFRSILDDQSELEVLESLS